MVSSKKNNAYPFTHLKIGFASLSGVEGLNKDVSTALDVTFLVPLRLLGILADIQKKHKD
ncbi:hypothetical protein JM83_3576 [Gillisia sp. Hel_I_86]|nr:hypothetical protein JM83_3576 [Gillisia sp. Hel_I_86]